MSTLRLPDLRELELPFLRSKDRPEPGAASEPGAATEEGPLPVLDLLREPRLEIGQSTLSSVLGHRRRLLLQGTTIGAVLLGLVLGVSALVFLRHQVVKSQMGALNEVESQAATLRQELERRNKQMATINEVNKQLSGALSNVRPTSALLSELQLRTPEGVQLLSADAADANLVVKGVASDPMAFARINAMQLEMRRSPLLDPLTINLSRLERKADAEGAAPVQFEISARFTPLVANQLEPVLRQLGSIGMARRLALLKKEGLMP